MVKTAVQIYISGVVQGVYYRAECQKYARQLELCGWVQNLVDGRVEVYALGTPEQLNQLEQWCRQGSPMSRVEQVTVNVAPVESGLQNFQIRS